MIELSENIQSAAITGNIRRMYDGIKKALGPTLNKTAPLRSSAGEVITDKGHHLKRWVKHNSDLYSRENIVSPSALDAIECLPTMQELDTEPTLRSSARPSTAWPLARPLAATGSLHHPPPSPPSRPNQALQDHLTAFSACSPLSVLARRSCTTRHEGRQDHHSLQEQEIGETATTTEASFFSAPLTKSL